MTKWSTLRLTTMALALASGALGCGGKGAAPPPAQSRTTGAGGPVRAGSAGVPRTAMTGVMMPGLPGGSGAGAPIELLGKPVRIQFRRDALGMAAPATLGPDAPSAGGRTIALDGTLIDLTDQWLVLRGQGRTYWIPHHVVLLIEAGG